METTSSWRILKGLLQGRLQGAAATWYRLIVPGPDPQDPRACCRCHPRPTCPLQTLPHPSAKDPAQTRMIADDAPPGHATATRPDPRVHVGPSLDLLPMVDLAWTCDPPTDPPELLPGPWSGLTSCQHHHRCHGAVGPHRQRSGAGTAQKAGEGVVAFPALGLLELRTRWRPKRLQICG